MHEKKKKDFGEVISSIIKEGFITDEKVEYAVRVQSKLGSPKPLLHVLKALNCVTDDQIKEALWKNPVSLPIGRLLVELGVISKAKMQAALQIQRESKPKQKLEEILVSRHFIREDKFLRIFALKLGIPFLEPESVEIDKDLFLKAPLKWYQSHHFIPIRKEKRKTLIAFGDPTNKKHVAGAREVFGDNILLGIARKTAISSAIVRAQQAFGKTGEPVKTDENSVVAIVDSIITEGILDGASDIHIEPLKDRLRIRFRLDGVLVNHKDFPLELAPQLTSRIKIMSKADIAEKRRHQGGRILFEYLNKDVDLRVSFYVTIYGEKVVLRILTGAGELIDIDELGMAPRMLERLKTEALEIPSGVVIITGPTGSGKTTSLYSCIKHINNPETSIITAEEPVEIVIDGIAQCSIDPKINLTFHETLRHIVRQDPDVIVIGEIRDNYSAEVAVQAALTGHKVLTTFHTEDSIGGLIRLLHMEIEAFLISSTVVCVVAQRLLRKVCSRCGEPYEPTPTEIHRLGYDVNGFQGDDFRRGRGCSYCKYTGYKGRIAVFEMLVLDGLIRDAILSRKTSYDIRRISIEQSGLVTLFEEGLWKAMKGLTTLDEVIRCLPQLHRPRKPSEIRRLLGE